jgi:hypothetical protein
MVNEQELTALSETQDNERNSRMVKTESLVDAIPSWTPEKSQSDQEAVPVPAFGDGKLVGVLRAVP